VLNLSFGNQVLRGGGYRRGRACAREGTSMQRGRRRRAGKALMSLMDHGGLNRATKSRRAEAAGTVYESNLHQKGVKGLRTLGPTMRLHSTHEASSHRSARYTRTTATRRVSKGAERYLFQKMAAS